MSRYMSFQEPAFSGIYTRRAVTTVGLIATWEDFLFLSKGYKIVVFLLFLFFSQEYNVSW